MKFKLNEILRLEMANLRRLALLVICAASCTAGCSSRSQGNDGQVIENPMTGIWNNIGSTIEYLETSRATMAQWTAKADSSEAIASGNQLQQLLAFAPVTEGDRKTALQLFGKSDETVHYGFEANYHAVVFFKHGKTVGVTKW